MFSINTTNDNANKEYTTNNGVDLIDEKRRWEAKKRDEWDERMEDRGMRIGMDEIRVKKG